MFPTEDIAEAMSIDPVVGITMYVVNQLDDLLFDLSNEEVIYSVIVRLEQDAAVQ